MTAAISARHRAIAMAARLAQLGDVARARCVIADLEPGPAVVIEVNEHRPIATPHARRVTAAPTVRMPYVPLADEADAWVAEYREARQ